MNNMNFDNKSMENIKNLVDNGDISDAISQISPEMIENFSKMFSNQTQKTEENNKGNNNSSQASSSNSSSDGNFNIDNIDINTIKKFSSVLGNMNSSKNDPRANLLNSLKPYLRDSKKSKLDNYMNLLNVSKIADLMKNANNNNKEN